MNGAFEHIAAGLSLDAHVFVDADGVAGLVEDETELADPVRWVVEGERPLGDVGPPCFAAAGSRERPHFDWSSGLDDVPRGPDAWAVAVG